MTPPAPSRLQHLDALRGLAALMVCLCHFRHAFTPAIEAVFKTFGDYGVFVFFVISGFIIPRVLGKEDYRLAHIGRFLAKRVVRLHPPYLLALALTLALSLAAASWKHEATTWSAVDLPAYLFYIREPTENPVFWTLRVEMCFYLFIGATFPFLNSNNAAIRWLTFLTPCVVWFFLADVLFVKFVSFFLIGIALEQRQRGINGPKEFAAKLIIAAALAFSETGLRGMCFGLATAALIGMPWRVSLPRPVLWFGAISYSFYLVHFPIGVKLLNLMLAKLPGVPSELLALTAGGASVLAAWVLHRIAERPAIALSQAMFDTGPQPARPTPAREERAMPLPAARPEASRGPP